MQQPLSSPPPWWESLRDRAYRASASPRADLRVDGQVAGSIAWPLVELLVEAGLPLAVDHHTGHIAPRGDVSSALGEGADEDLVCATRPGYTAALSADSRRALVLQGGEFTARQARAFIERPHAPDAVRLRLRDDQAKVWDLRTPGLDHYLAIARRCNARQVRDGA